jgi:hypothetical protein
VRIKSKEEKESPPVHFFELSVDQPQELLLFLHGILTDRVAVDLVVQQAELEIFLQALIPEGWHIVVSGYIFTWWNEGHRMSALAARSLLLSSVGDLVESLPRQNMQHKHRVSSKCYAHLIQDSLYSRGAESSSSSSLRPNCSNTRNNLTSDFESAVDVQIG